jgi:hypothetical protein
MSRVTSRIIKIPSSLSVERKKALFEAIKLWIQDRSFRGLDRNNRNFKKYSEEYAEKKGVGVNDVDLTLTGEMLDSIELLGYGSDYLRIGYSVGTSVERKAEGNILGSYGRDPNPAKARDFLDISVRDLKAILADFKLTDSERFEDDLNRNLIEIRRNSNREDVDNVIRQFSSRRTSI